MNTGTSTLGQKLLRGLRWMCVGPAIFGVAALINFNGVQASKDRDMIVTAIDRTSFHLTTS